MITRKRVHEMYDKLTNMRNTDTECIACQSAPGRYHSHDCVLAAAATMLVEMFDMLDYIHDAMAPFRMGDAQ